jgi:hypothetical protein
MKAYGGTGGISPPFLTTALDGGELSASRPCRFTPSSQSRSERCGDSLPGIKPKPVARRYTDWAIAIARIQGEILLQLLLLKKRGVALF